MPHFEGNLDEALYDYLESSAYEPEYCHHCGAPAPELKAYGGMDAIYCQEECFLEATEELQ